MDEQRFDGLVRALGSGTSRRGALGLLAAAAGLGLHEVSAKAKHHKGKGKGKGRGNPQGQAGPPAGKGGCKAPNTKCGKGKQMHCCTGGQVCQNGGCVTACEPSCAASKPCGDDRCGGSCGTCTGADQCVGGQCTGGCPVATPDLCGATCVNLQTDVNHCGGCGTTCPAANGQTHVLGATCRNSTCQLTCDPGYADCNGDAGCETSLGTVLDCLGCGDSCTHFADQCNAPICGASGCVGQPTNEGQGCNGGTGTCRDGACLANTCTPNYETCDPRTSTCCDPGDDGCIQRDDCVAGPGTYCC